MRASKRKLFARADSPILTIPEAADYLGLGATSIYSLIASGELRSLKFGKARRVTRAACDELISARERESH